MVYQQHKSEESIEDYLEAILMLSKEISNVRSIDIVHKLGFSKPSISMAMKNLKAKSLINISDSGYITLTETGLQRASKIYERHTLISKWLISLGVPPEVATEDACRMEHDISTETFSAIKSYIKSSASIKEI